VNFVLKFQLVHVTTWQLNAVNRVSHHHPLGLSNCVGLREMGCEALLLTFQPGGNLTI
jgi:hypothetical protein